MKRWALVVVALYFLILVAMTPPLTMLAFYPLREAYLSLAPLGLGYFWALVAALVAAQAAMLLVPVDISFRRPEFQRSIIWPVVASGLCVGILGMGLVFSVNEYLRKANADSLKLWLPFCVLFAVWGAWTLIFYRASRPQPAMDVVARQCNYLLKGSILELLVAVPTHIVARMRDYCCAGFYTFTGIVFGVAVMLFSFGPGVFFLFAARWRRLRPQKAEAAS